MKEEEIRKGFDYRAVIKDPKTGKVIKEQHYYRHVSLTGGEILERDGEFFYPDNSPAPNPRKSAIITNNKPETHKVHSTKE